MEIKTKHNVGDHVWFLDQNKVTEANIIRASNSQLRFAEGRISWDLDIEATGLYSYKGSIMTKYDDELFSSKQELIDSL